VTARFDNSDIEILLDSARRFLADAHNLVALGPQTVWEKQQAAFMDLGWTSITLADELPGCLANAEIVAELFAAVGETPSSLPLLDMIVGVPIVATAAADRAAALQSALLGESLAVLAIWPDGIGHPVDDQPEPWHGVELEVRGATGHKTLVNAASSCDQFIIFGTCNGEPCIAVARAASPGVTTERLRSPDPMAELGIVRFDQVPAVELATGASAVRAYETLEALARVATIAELGGAAKRAVDLAVDYAKVRVQFGRPIGAFQAIKHILADAMLDVYGIESTSQSIARRVAHGADPAELDESRIYASHAARRAVESALQVHGGIGFTQECKLSWYFHRVSTLWAAWGDPCALATRRGQAALGLTAFGDTPNPLGN
jgi:alkylation response protein AidB-like acyl-CoA dehydrogenase